MKQIRLNKISLFIVGLAFLAAIFHPGLSQAMTSTGTASLFGLNLTSDIALSWLDPAVIPPADTRGSFSGITYGTDPVFLIETTDFIDGAPWGPTTVSIPGFGNANTAVNPTNGSFSMFAQTDITSNSYAEAFAQAVLSGQFFVTQTTTFSATAAYSLAQFLVGLSGFAYNDVSVGLTLEDFDTGAQIFADQRFFANSTNGAGFTFADAGTLTIPSTILLAGTYNFEAQASTTARVPEPGTLILLSSGLIGLGAFRKRFPKIRFSNKKA